jgi:hypothetical protein
MSKGCSTQQHARHEAHAPQHESIRAVCMQCVARVRSIDICMQHKKDDSRRNQDAHQVHSLTYFLTSTACTDVTIVISVLDYIRYTCFQLDLELSLQKCPDVIKLFATLHLHSCFSRSELFDLRSTESIHLDVIDHARHAGCVRFA